MNCPYCNNYLPPGVTTCPNCHGSVPDNMLGAVWPGQQQTIPSIPNYLLQAVLTTISCCPPTGIVSIIYATSVDKKLAAGDFVGAKSASDKAKTWWIVSLIAGFVFQFLWFFIMILVTVLAEE